jgi:hypothetical protein
VKYVIVMKSGLETPFVFPEWVTHEDAARALTFDHLDQVVSAGFVSFGVSIHSEVNAMAWGKSTSLKKDSRPEDSALITQALDLKMC